MSDGLRESFVNPYVDESANEARFSAVVTMDEAHERWITGKWRADKANFNLDESFFNGENEPVSSEISEKNRFAFDLKRDIIDGDVDSNRLDGISYSASYRPQGSLGSNISNLTVDRLRYNALADIKEELPDDLSYLYGNHSVHRARQGSESSKVRSRDRLPDSVDKRRSEVDKMLPERSGETPEMIMADIKRRREIEDAKSGIVSKSRARKYVRGIYENWYEPGSVEKFSDASEDYAQNIVTDRGSWRGEIPVQDGLVPDTKSLPYFGRFSRTWSEIDQLNPTRSDMLRHTVNTIYEDDDPQPKHSGSRFRPNNEGRNEHYVSDIDFDPDDRYRRLKKQRRQVRADSNVLENSVMSGEFNNPYVDISNDRLKKLLNTDMRGPGNSPDPEGLTDPALLYEWNMGYSRVNTNDNKYASWLKEQGMLAEKAEQSRYRGSHRTGRPGAYMQREKPYGKERKYPRGNQREHELRRRDMTEQMQKATERGMAEGREMIRRKQAAERKRRAQMIKQQQEYYRRQQEQMIEQQQAYYKQQQEQMAKQQAYYRQHQEQSAKSQTRENGAKFNSQPAGAAPANSRQGAVGNVAPNAPQYGPWGYYSYNQPRSSAAAPSSAPVHTNAGRGRTQKG